MLVLTRKTQQCIVIGEEQITVKILEIRGGRVRLGIDAPTDVTIRRAEVPAQVPVPSDSELVVPASY